MRRERLLSEIEEVRRHHGDTSHDDELSWIRIESWELNAGWNRHSTPVLVLLPGGYPTTPPDNFYTTADLRLANGVVPTNASLAHILNQQWLQFSYHVEDGDWRGSSGPGAHNLTDFLHGVAIRLSEMN
jgi:hypothetical protein